MLPHTWNHLKKQYVAIMFGNTPRFISETTNFSRSGCNADIEYSYDFKDNEIIIIKTGSHKHQTQSYYITTSETKCVFICEVEDDVIINHNFTNENTISVVEKEIEKSKKAFLLSEKKKRVMKLAWIIAKQTETKTNTKAIFSECLKLAWKYEFSYNHFNDWHWGGDFDSFLELEKEKEEKNRIEEKIKKQRNVLLKKYTELDELSYWNKKIYSENRIYIDNTCYHLTDEQVKELELTI